ncbi:hypothetical protein [Trinickia sp. EG282A]|uniref:hypothetical protein n=1 Tax=Trinickia sp. EG282A TaxID=3237013 RepID=UPI0034D1D90E
MTFLHAQKRKLTSGDKADMEPPAKRRRVEARTSPYHGIGMNSGPRLGAQPEKKKRKLTSGDKADMEPPAKRRRVEAQTPPYHGIGMNSDPRLEAAFAGYAARYAPDAALPLPAAESSTGASGAKTEPYRVSANGKLAVPIEQDPQKFFADPATVERSNRILKAMRSKVKLRIGGHAPPSLVGMKEVRLENIEEGKSVFDVYECIDVARRVTNAGEWHAIYAPRGRSSEVCAQAESDRDQLA